MSNDTSLPYCENCSAHVEVDCDGPQNVCAQCHRPNLKYQATKNPEPILQSVPGLTGAAAPFPKHPSPSSHKSYKPTRIPIARAHSLFDQIRKALT
jgi:hypothetical protein